MSAELDEAGPVAADHAALLGKAERKFLVSLGKSGNPTLARQAAKLTRRHVDARRRADPTFAAAYDDAIEEAADRLEAEAWRRAIQGVARPVIKAGQKVVDPDTGLPLTIRRYSDPLLVMLLRGSRPGKFQSRSMQIGPVDPTTVLREIASDYDPPRAEHRPYQ